MKHLFLILVLIFASFTATAAVPTYNEFNANQFSSNVFKVNIKSGALTTNLSVRGTAHVIGNLNVDGTLTSGDFELDSGGAVIDASGNATFQTISGDGSGITGLIFNGPFTNVSIFTTDNNPNATGSAVILIPQEKPSIPGTAALLLEAQPPYNPGAWFKGKWRFVSGIVTNTLGSTNKNVTWANGYNFSGNNAGVSSYGDTDTNQSSFLTQFEPIWQNLAGLAQAEWWNDFRTPYTIWGTNYGFRFLSANLVWNDLTKEFVSSDGNITLGKFDFVNPRGSGLQGIRIEAADPFSRSMNLDVWGTGSFRTNDVGLGGATMHGGVVIWTVPSGVTAQTVQSGIDWNDGEGIRNDFYLRRAGADGAFTSTGFTNWSLARNAMFIHGANSRIQATNAHFSNITNTSTTDAILVADANGKMLEMVVGANLTYTAATRTLDASGSGSGDTNAISYIPDLKPAVRTRVTSTGVPVLEALHTNGTPWLILTNNATDNDEFHIQLSSGFKVLSAFGVTQIALRSPGAFIGVYNDSQQWMQVQTGSHVLNDEEGDVALDFTEADDVQIPGATITTANSTTVNVGSGGIVLAENSGLIADPALSADGKYTPVIVRAGTAGATLAFGDLIVLDPTDSRWELADANAASGADGDARGNIGICVLAAAADGDPTTILFQGWVRADAAFPALTINGSIYVSETAGDITQTVPTTSGNVIRRLGAASTADEIYFSPGDFGTYVP